MKESYYINQDGILKRKDNTVYFVNENVEQILPVDQISSIYCYGRVTISSGIVSYFAQKGVPIHFFNTYGFYESSLYPRENLVSGDVTVRQAEHYLDNGKRLFLARQFIFGCTSNILKNLAYYGRQEELKIETDRIKAMLDELVKCDSVSSVLNVEGRMWDTYYRCYDKILPEEFKFESRTRQPPENMVNCLISFGNSLLYSTVLSEIYNTQLNPTISFLHEPSNRRFSLSLDISEVFKPFIVDRVNFKLLNKRILDEKDFDQELNSCLLNDKGRRKYLTEWDEKLHTTIKHRTLGRNVSYRHLIRLECYKLVKHVLGDEEYKPFIIWW